MRILFLDDSEPRHAAFRSWTIGHVVEHVRSVRQALAALEGERFDLASLDHDLCAASSVGLEPTEPTGMFVVEAIIRMPWQRRPKAVSVHSMNPGAAPRMVIALYSFVPAVYRAPFSEQSVSHVLSAVARLTR